MMTLDEAITHAQGVAQKEGCSECGEQHRQLAAWLLQLVEVTKQRDALLIDAERLDYIEAHPEKNLQKHKKHWSFMGFTNYEYDAFPTLREAIDAARSTS